MSRGTDRGYPDQHELDQILDSLEDEEVETGWRDEGNPDFPSVIVVGDHVRLRGGRKVLKVDHISASGRVMMTYLHSQCAKHAHIRNLIKVTNVIQRKEEQQMSQYGTQQFDLIFEAIVRDQYYTVKVGFDDGSDRRYAYRVPNEIVLEELDQVLVSVNGNRNAETFSLATVEMIDSNPSAKATGWVVQKVDTTAYKERQAQWKLLYEGVKEAEIARRQAKLAEGYEEELAKYAPQAAAILKGFTQKQLPKGEE